LIEFFICLILSAKHNTAFSYWGQNLACLDKQGRSNEPYPKIFRMGDLILFLHLLAFDFYQ